jgi:hypothetical protein
MEDLNDLERIVQDKRNDKRSEAKKERRRLNNTNPNQIITHYPIHPLQKKSQSNHNPTFTFALRSCYLHFSI